MNDHSAVAALLQDCQRALEQLSAQAPGPEGRADADTCCAGEAQGRSGAQGRRGDPKGAGEAQGRPGAQGRRGDPRGAGEVRGPQGHSPHPAARPLPPPGRAASARPRVAAPGR